MFNKKAKEIKKLNSTIEKINTKRYAEQKENFDDFILILNQIQELNNNKSQWKHRQLEINNAIVLAREKYVQKIVELDIDPQY